MRNKMFDGYKFKAAADNVEELLIYGNIGAWYVDGITVTKISDELKQKKGKDINVRINSYGGEAYAGIAIHNLLKAHDGKVNVYIDGIAASAASIIAMAGTVHMPKNATIMIHNAWNIAAGNKHDFRKFADVLATLDDAIIMTYATKTGLAADEITKLMDDETYMLGEVAKEKGFADIITDDAIDEATAKAFLAAAKMQMQDNSEKIRQAAAKLNAKSDEWPEDRTNENTPEAKGDINDKTKKDEVNAMDMETLKAQHPDLFASILAAGKEDGIKAERDRLKSIDAAAVKGFDQLVNDAKYGENPMDAGGFALAVLKAQKAQGQNFLANAKQDAQAAEVEDTTPADEKEVEQAKIKTAVNMAKGGTTI